jgi:hypothetical protein
VRRRLPLQTQVVIFVKSVARAKQLNKLLGDCNFPSICIHSSMKQEERLQVPHQTLFCSLCLVQRLLRCGFIHLRCEGQLCCSRLLSIVLQPAFPLQLQCNLPALPCERGAARGNQLDLQRIRRSLG